MESHTRKKLEVHLVLNEDEALTLRAMMQNPQTGEPPEISQFRKALWENLTETLKTENPLFI